MILGAVYLNMKKFSEAVKELQIAVQHDPDNITLLKQYVLALESQINKIA